MLGVLGRNQDSINTDGLSVLGDGHLSFAIWAQVWQLTSFSDLLCYMRNPVGETVRIVRFVTGEAKHALIASKVKCRAPAFSLVLAISGDCSSTKALEQQTAANVLLAVDCAYGVTVATVIPSR